MVKRTDKEAIEDVMSNIAAIETSAEIILRRSDDEWIDQEVKFQMECIELARITLAGWWKKARRRTKS